MLDDVRVLLHRAINTKRGDFFPPFRIQKRIARKVNAVLGSPLKSRDELAAIQERGGEMSAPEVSAKPEPAPVMVYFEKDRNVRELERIKDTLRARNIEFKLLDVSGDPATISFVSREAGCDDDELPVVFVAGTPVGCYNELVQWDVSGRLMSSVFGTNLG